MAEDLFGEHGPHAMEEDFEEHGVPPGVNSPEYEDAALQATAKTAEEVRSGVSATPGVPEG